GADEYGRAENCDRTREEDAPEGRRVVPREAPEEGRYRFGSECDECQPEEEYHVPSAGKVDRLDASRQNRRPYQTPDQSVAARSRKAPKPCEEVPHDSPEDPSHDDRQRMQELRVGGRDGADAKQDGVDYTFISRLRNI